MEPHSLLILFCRPQPPLLFRSIEVYKITCLLRAEVSDWLLPLGSRDTCRHAFTDLREDVDWPTGIKSPPPSPPTRPADCSPSLSSQPQRPQQRQHSKNTPAPPGAAVTTAHLHRARSSIYRSASTRLASRARPGRPAAWRPVEERDDTPPGTGAPLTTRQLPRRHHRYPGPPSAAGLRKAPRGDAHRPHQPRNSQERSQAASGRGRVGCTCLWLPHAAPPPTDSPHVSMSAG